VIVVTHFTFSVGAVHFTPKADIGLDEWNVPLRPYLDRSGLVSGVVKWP